MKHALSKAFDWFEWLGERKLF